ncbi:MAG: DMT family transporter [Rhodospirillaceae bacterium]|nr:DMT family transporter [Rhodospirillaceae bacterium]
MVAPRSASSAPLVGVLYMCMAAGFGLPGLNALVKALIADYHMVQIIWFRCVVHLGFMVVLFMPAMGPRLFASRRPWLQSIRSLTQLVTFTLIWVALFWTPITTVTMVLFTGPLILVALSVPFLGERVGPRRWAAVFVGFAGVLIVLRPGADAVHWGALLVLGGAFFYAIYQIQTRKLAGHDDPRTTAVYTILAAFIVATVAVPFFWEMPRSTVDWLLFLSLGVVGGLAHYFIIKAYQYAEASLVGPFDYSQLVGASIFGFAFFGEVPDAWTWVGAAVIIASGLYIAHREARLRRTAT